jgi:hypothetical protein
MIHARANSTLRQTSTAARRNAPTADALRPIETVGAGDLLWARDEITGEVGLRPRPTSRSSKGG